MIFAKKVSPIKQISFGGFSQGACLAAEYLIRNTQSYGGLFVFSGTCIGPLGMTWEKNGSFDGMPVFNGGSDIDPWVMHDLLIETADNFRKWALM
jgi:predicted esterase